MRLTEEEKLFEKLKDCILVLHLNVTKMETDSQLKETWLEQSKNVTNEIKLLSEEKRKWLESQYIEWHKTLGVKKLTLDLNPFIQ